MRVAVVGAGAAGLCSAYWLSARHDVTLYEAEDRLGGHAHTVEVGEDGAHFGIDTGFIVYNERNYPLFSALLDELRVKTQPSEMSFSVSSGRADFEYRGNGLGLWAQPSNILDPSFSRLLRDILRFNADARHLLSADSGLPDMRTINQLLAEGGYHPRLAEQYVLPLGSAIWSADPSAFGAMPALTFARFMDNHGMLQLKGRPRWRTISGGSASYVAALRAAMSAQVRLGACVHKVARATDSVTLLSDAGPESYDAVVLAVHSDQALALLGDPSRDEREILGAIRYRPNVATLHTDTSLLPRRRRAWAAWNAYLPQTSRAGPTLTYWMNCLQRLETRTQFCVTLNLEDQIAPGSVLGRWTCHHPVFDTGAVAAQARGASIQGQRRTWYCGAYWGYGFHEDAVASAARVCDQLNGVVG